MSSSVTSSLLFFLASHKISDFSEGGFCLLVVFHQMHENWPNLALLEFFS